LFQNTQCGRQERFEKKKKRKKNGQIPQGAFVGLPCMNLFAAIAHHERNSQVIPQLQDAACFDAGELHAKKCENVFYYCSD